jgi:hypothetical protein
MSNPIKAKLVNLFTLLVLLLTTVQGLLPTMPIANPQTITIVSAVLIFLVSSLTALKQWLSVEIANNALKSTLVIAILAILGGANDLFNVIPVSQVANQWIRFTITGLMAFINLASKVMYPTLNPVKQEDKTI